MAKKILEYLHELCYSIFRVEVSEEGEVSMDNKELTVLDVANFFRSKESMTQKKITKINILCICSIYY